MFAMETFVYTKVQQPPRLAKSLFGSDMMSDDKSTVKSVAKAFAVLRSFSAENSELVLAEVARGAGVDNATAFRMLNTLVQLGYVEKVSDTRRFRLGFKCLELGFNAIARSDIRQLGRPLLRSLVNDTIEAASIGVLDGHDAIYIERIQAGLQRLAVDIRVGNRIPAYSSALGRAMLAHLPVETQRALLDDHPLERLTEHTIIDSEKIIEELARVRETGFAVSDQETVTGLRVLAAPITDIDGVPVAAMSVAAPAFGRTLQEFIDIACDATCEAAAKLSAAVRAAGGTVVPRQT